MFFRVRISRGHVYDMTREQVDKSQYFSDRILWEVDNKVYRGYFPNTNSAWIVDIMEVTVLFKYTLMLHVQIITN